MAGVVRTKAQMSVQGAVGLGSFPYDRALGVTKWFGPHNIEIADGVSEQSIVALLTQGLTTITHLAITSDQNISVTFGAAGSNTPTPLNAFGLHLMTGTSLTAVSLSNASGFTAKVTLAVAGS